MEKLPIITIAGVPNTGKSTLFNRLTGKRRALVHSSPGMTRDIFRELYQLNGKNLYLQDSGGFFPVDDVISKEINKRVLKAAKNSDVVIFLFDGRRELLGYEKELFLDIKKINRNDIAVINKADISEKCILSS